MDSMAVTTTKNSFGELFGDIDGNPVTKIKMEVLRVGTRLEIVPAATTTTTNNQPQAERATLALHEHENRQMLACLQQICTHQQEQFQLIRNEQADQREWLRQQVQLVLNNQRRFGGTAEGSMARQNPRRQRDAQDHTAALQAQTANRRQAQAPALPARRREADPQARLEPNLKTLLDFWREHNFGIGTNKAARTFTTAEKNQGAAIKMKCSRRMKIWRIQIYLLNAGLTIEAANQKIIDAYQTDKPTAIILCVTRDQKNQSYNFIGSQRFHPRLVMQQPR